MRGAIPPFAQYVFMACCLVKHRDNFTFPLPYCTARVVNMWFVSQKKSDKISISSADIFSY